MNPQVAARAAFYAHFPGYCLNVGQFYAPKDIRVKPASEREWLKSDGCNAG